MACRLLTAHSRSRIALHTRTWRSRSQSLAGHVDALLPRCLSTEASGVESSNRKAAQIQVELSELDKRRTTLQSELDALTKASNGQPIQVSSRVGGAFVREKDPTFLQTRNDLFEKFHVRQLSRQQEALQQAALEGHGIEALQAQLEAGQQEGLEMLFPDGRTVVVPRPRFDVSPADLASAAGFNSRGRAGGVVARLRFQSLPKSSAAGEALAVGQGLASALAGEDESGESGDGQNTTTDILWDLSNPLPFVDGAGLSDLLKIEIFGHESSEAQTVLRHSSAHVLGACFENLFGAQLTIGPPTADGFFYDAYMGSEDVATGLTPDDLKAMTKYAHKNFLKKRLPFERVTLTKEEALELFASNPFKLRILDSKVGDGELTSAYRVGNMVDLCLGPHIPHTGHIGSFEATSASRSYFQGDAANGDPLQRVYGVAFAAKNGVKEWRKWRADAEERDHRRVGDKQDLFFFSQHSPGSAFFTPQGATIYQRLVDFVRRECRKDGIREVITPNIFKLDLWETSGHAQHYQDDMFTFETDDQDTFGLKPMNCPAHCVMYGQRTRSFRDLPIRYLDFGALHRNELSGALGGLTRVRRFQQDDVHIFCRQDQVKQEVQSTLGFLDRVYGILGMEYSACLSTRPEKAMGDIAAWDEAEEVMAESLDEFCGENQWELNPGDGAFYGPKIDIRVRDALGRSHQCATVQLDFQLPLRFDLTYRSSENTAALSSATPDASTNAAVTDGLRPGEQRPVIIHRAMLGSVERMMAILCEHYNGS